MIMLNLRKLEEDLGRKLEVHEREAIFEYAERTKLPMPGIFSAEYASFMDCMTKTFSLYINAAKRRGDEKAAMELQHVMENYGKKSEGPS